MCEITQHLKLSLFTTTYIATNFRLNCSTELSTSVLRETNNQTNSRKLSLVLLSNSMSAAVAPRTSRLVHFKSLGKFHGKYLARFGEVNSSGHNDKWTYYFLSLMFLSGWTQHYKRLGRRMSAQWKKQRPGLAVVKYASILNRITSQLNTERTFP
jgi:hypothetical protein